MSAENIDFTALLANMEAKRAALDGAIASMKVAIATGALGGTGTGDLPVVASIPGMGSTEIPNGAFLGKTVSEAIKLYLAISKRKQKTKEIEEALLQGGIESTSTKFGNIVFNALKRMSTVTGEVAKIGKEWGLAEWYHPGIRSGSSPKRAPKHAKQKRARVPQSGAPSGEGLPSRIEKFLASKPETNYTPTEIATALSVKPIAVNVRLKRLVERGRIAKTAPGQYRAAKTSVIKMPAAG